MANVPTMENAGKCVLYIRQPAGYVMSPTLDKHNKNLRIMLVNAYNSLCF